MPSHHTPVDHPTTTSTPIGDGRDAATLSPSPELHSKSATLAMTNSDNSWKHDADDHDQSPADDLGHDTDQPSSTAPVSSSSFDDSQSTNTTARASPETALPSPTESAPPLNHLENSINEEKKAPEELTDVPAKENDFGFDTDKPLTMTTYMVVPPDGGWGWVVAAASFFCNIVVDGIIFTFGTFLESISKDLGVSRAKVTIVGSLLSGFYLMAGPFVSALANRYGFRLVTIVGAILAAAAFAISALATNIEFLFVFYGILGGIGFGLIYVPAVITVGFYFEKWRAIATGIAVCGSGIGTFMLAPLFSALIESVGWQYTFLIQAGIILSCAIFGALFRPLKPTKVTVPYDPTKADEVEAKQILENKDETNRNPEDLPLLLRIKQARDEQRTLSMTSLEYNAYLTASQIQHSSTRVLKSSCLSLNVAVSPAQSPTPVMKRAVNGSAMNGVENRINVPPPLKAVLSIPQSVPSPPASPDMTRLLAQDNHYLTICAPFTFRRASADDRRRFRPRSESSGRIHLMGNGARSRAATTGASARQDVVVSPAGARPMYRDDIFFGAPLQRLEQFASQTSALDYTMSVTRLPTRADLDEEKEKQCKLCPEAVKRTLATMLDVSLLRSPTFLLLAASGFMTMMGFYVPFMYLTDRAKQGGIDASTSVLLISAIGIANTIGRVVCGIVTSMPSVNALLINNVALTLGGLGTMFSGLWITPLYQFSYACVFGVGIACFASLRSILIVDLMGLEKLTNAFGLLLLFQGIAAAIGAPLAGSLLDENFNYDPSFYLSGSLILISAIMCYPLNWLNNWEKRRKEENEKEAMESKVV